MQQFFRRLELPVGPVFHLEGATEGWVSHASENGTSGSPAPPTLSSLTVAYYTPADQRRLFVTNSSAAHTRGLPDLRSLAEWVRIGDLDDGPPGISGATDTKWIGPPPVPTTVLVDHEPQHAERLSLGEVTIIRCLVNDVWVTISGRASILDEPVKLLRLHDCEPLKSRREIVLQGLS